MNAKNETVISENREEIVDDLNKEVLQVSETELDNKKLNDLKLKLAAKNGEKMAPRIVEKKKYSLRFGVVGTGHAGGKISETFSSYGYECVVLNTATQDLDLLNIAPERKLHLNYGLGGASRELSIGREAVLEHKDSVYELIDKHLSGCDVFVLCSSLGGGSGSGSLPVLIDIMSSMGKPIVLLVALTANADDAQSKDNSLQTLSELSKLAQNKTIANVILIDNAKIESVFAEVSHNEFFNVANKAVVETLDMFNTLSSLPSSSKPLDPTEFSKIMLDGAGFTSYGSISISNFAESDTSIAEAIINNLTTNLFAANFDLTHTRYAGFILTAPKSVWDQIPSANIAYASAVLNDVCGLPKAVFKGIYETNTEEQVLKVYSIFSGLVPPHERVEQLQREVKEHASKIKTKDEVRDLSLKINTGVEESVSAADKVRQKIQNKNSAFGKLNKSIIDRRNKN